MEKIKWDLLVSNFKFQMKWGTERKSGDTYFAKPSVTEQLFNVPSWVLRLFNRGHFITVVREAAQFSITSQSCEIKPTTTLHNRHGVMMGPNNWALGRWVKTE